MNKQDLIKSIVKETGIEKKTVQKIVGGILEKIAVTLENGDRVSLIGFGSFSVTDRKARQGRNPKNGDVVQIPARKSVRFKAGKALLDSMK